MKSQTRNIILVLLFNVLFISNSVAQDFAFKLFNESGKSVKYNKMVSRCAEADIVLFGEQHNNPISHWLQLELLEDLFLEKGASLVVGAEMFESDNQLIMDEYFNGMLTTEKFEEEMRLWPNYKTDYKPLVEFSKDSGLKFIATNVPRRYANVTYKLGIDTLGYLSDEAKSYLAPLPLVFDTTLSCYSALAGGGQMGGHGSKNLMDAQAIKDATMSHFIMKNRSEKGLFLHFNGAYHSDNFESINYWLLRDKTNLKIVTISTVNQEDVSKLEKENEGLANFIIAVPENMTTTY